jgi:hypothetical protein
MLQAWRSETLANILLDGVVKGNGKASAKSQGEKSQ